MISLELIREAAARIAPHVRLTPVSHDAKRDAYFKWENCQVTGSFKARGAFNKVLTLEAWQQQKGLITASAGNHGQGVALAGMLVHVPVIVFVSEHAVPAKLDAMRALGAQIRMVVGGYADAEKAAMKFAEDNYAVWISPYNDPLVIAGQGTIGLELADQLPLTGEMTVVVPVGGGGLASGIGAALAASSNRPKLVAVQSQASRFMHEIYHHGSQAGVVDLPSLADGLAGAVEAGSMTIELVRELVQDVLVVTEEEIGNAIAFAWKEYDQQIEGSAAVALAAVLTGKVRPPTVSVITGGNIAADLHATLVARSEVRS